MTDTLQRPSLLGGLPGPTAPTLLGPLGTGTLAALRVALVGLLLAALPVLVVWAVDGRAGAPLADALRTAGQLWLVAHGASLQVPEGPVGLTPLGLFALPLVLLVRSGARQARSRPVSSLRAALRLAAGTAVPYAVLALLVANLSGTGDIRPSLPATVTGSVLLALVGIVLGSVREGYWFSEFWSARPARLRRLARATLLASAVLAGAGALRAGGSLAVHGRQAADLAAAGSPGVVGGLALLLLGLSLVPNAVVWAGSWLVGPGFAVGVGTTVGPFGHQLGAVPALPLFAALPAGGVPGWLGALALLVPLTAGALAGRSVQRGLPGAGVRRVVAEAALVGPAAGAAWLLLAALAGGPVGGQRLAEVGPAAWAVGLAVTGLVGLAAALTALILQRRFDGAE